MIIHSHFFSFSKKICFKNCKIGKRSLILSLESLSEFKIFHLRKLMHILYISEVTPKLYTSTYSHIYRHNIMKIANLNFFFNFWKYVSKHICAVSSSPSIQIFSKVGSMSFPQCCSKVWAKEKNADWLFSIVRNWPKIFLQKWIWKNVLPKLSCQSNIV